MVPYSFLAFMSVVFCLLFLVTLGWNTAIEKQKATLETENIRLTNVVNKQDAALNLAAKALVNAQDTIAMKQQIINIFKERRVFELVRAYRARHQSGQDIERILRDVEGDAA